MLKMTKEEIIEQNLKLGEMNTPIMEFIDKQEKLIAEFIGLGYTREEFFMEARKRAVATGRISLVGRC